MKNRLKLAKEMLKARLEEAKSEETRPKETRSEDAKSQEKPVRGKNRRYIQKPPRYMGIIFILVGFSFFFFLTDELRSI